MFVSGALLAVLLGLTIYDEDVIAVEHVLTLMTLLGGLVAVCRWVTRRRRTCQEGGGDSLPGLMERLDGGRRRCMLRGCWCEQNVGRRLFKQACYFVVPLHCLYFYELRVILLKKLP